MKKFIRILCAVLALTFVLTGCAAPKLVIGGTPKNAATCGDTTVSTGEYLAYLYNAFYNMYYSQGLYQYASYYDVWSQTLTYGEGDDAKEVDLTEYIKLVAQDSIRRQIVLEKKMAEADIKWDEEDEKSVDESLASLPADAYMSFGISNENFIKVYKKLNLNEQGYFYGLYGKDGAQAVDEVEQKAYFNDNFAYYKIITASLTDSEGSEMDDAAKKQVTDELTNTYLAMYEKDKNFEAVVDAYNKATSEEGTEITPSTDEGNRKVMDTANAGDSNAELAAAIKGVNPGEAKVVTYKANGTTATAALVLRLAHKDNADWVTEQQESVLYGMKFKDFDKELKEEMAKLDIKFKKSVIDKCDPKDFVQE